MDQLVETYKNTGEIHHAYLIEGGREESLKHVFNFLENSLLYETRGNPDFWFGDHETFGIDESRDLRMRQGTRSVRGGKKIFVLWTGQITREAQNALLKVFEEPTEDTHFFLMVPSASALLETLRSRLLYVRLVRDNLQIDSDFDIEAFVSSGLPQRLKNIRKMCDDKDKSRALELVSRLELYFHQNTKVSGVIRVQALNDIVRCRGYLFDRSPSVKTILEFLSLSVSVIK